MLYIILVWLFLLVICGLKLKENGIIMLDRNYSESLKGIFALYIMFHHLVIARQNVGFLEPIKYFAFPIVSFFLFMSGYGLMKSYNKTQEINLKHFFCNRVFRVFIPYFIVILVFFAYSYISSDFSVNIVEFFKNIILAKKIGPLWYMTTITVIYFIFPFIFKFFKKNVGIYLFGILTLIYLIVGIIVNIPANWLSSIIGFFLGILYADQEKNINKILENYNISVVSIAFIILFIMRLLISMFITDCEVLHLPYRNILDILFILIIIMISSRIEFKSKFILFFGKISYEIYIIHPFLIYLYSENIRVNSLYCLIVFVFTIFLSLLLSCFQKFFSKIKILLIGAVKH